MDWREECRRVHAEGLNKLAKDGYLPFLLRPYNGSETHILKDMILRNGVDDYVREKLRTVVVEFFRRFSLPAVLIQSDTYQVDGYKFRQYFGLPENLPPDRFQEEYGRILDEKFEGTAEKLPQELWIDGIITCIKGPMVLPISFATSYHKDNDGALKFDETNELEGGYVNLLPDWWEASIN